MAMQPIPFGKYVLVERLAQGGMAEVFRAVYQGAHGFEKEVAVKRILPVFDGLGDFVTMFVDEARIASSLTHVNIAQVFDFGQQDGSYFLAMELVDGVDLGRLREAAARRGLRVPVPVAAFIASEAARALAYAHEKRGADGAPLGIVHRDVSPHNVIVSYAGEVKLVDFGIAKATGKLHKTESGAVMGKIRYMSPEQIAGEPLDGRSDLFALGVVLWELLAGVALWPGDNPGAVADQIRKLPIEPPSRRAREVPPELDRIVLRALERPRDARQARAADFARELSGWLAQAAPSLTREDVGAFVQEVVPREKPPVEAALDPGAATASSKTDVELAATRPAKVGTPTAQEPPTVPARRRGRGLLVAAGVLLVAGGVVAARFVSFGTVTPSTPPPQLVDAAVAHVVADAGVATVADADKLRLVAELEALPRADATVRGVPSEDYKAVMSAVDAALCLTPAGGKEPVVPADLQARVDAERLGDETRALWRYLAVVGALPPRVAGALQAFLRSHPPSSPGAAGWTMARLGALVSPDDAALRLAVLRQNGARGAWRAEPQGGAPGPHRDLCERRAAVEAYAARAPGDRATLLQRFLAAAPPDQPVDADGVRYTLLGFGERDDAAATLELHLRVTNPGGDERPLALGDARLAGLASPPTVDPPAARLGAGLVRDVRLTFAGVTDEVAEAAVLVLRPGVELAAYSEDLK